MTTKPLDKFKHSEPLTLGVELELQLVGQRDFDLTRAASDLLLGQKYDGSHGDIKFEITESMIEINTLAQSSVDAIAMDLRSLRENLRIRCQRNNVCICGGGTHPFHRWPERRISPGERFEELYRRYGYLTKQFTVFGQHIHVGCGSADDAIWLTQALGVFVPAFVALSASSPFVDGVDTAYHSARLNAVSAFPLSGQCPPVADWRSFVNHFGLLQRCGIVESIKDLYWDVRPKPEFGTVEIRVCDTPLTIERATALAALAQSLSRWLLRSRPELHFDRQVHVARFNKFQACRFGTKAMIADPVAATRQTLETQLATLFEIVRADARELGCERWLEQLLPVAAGQDSDAGWLRTKHAEHGNLNDVVCEAASRWMLSNGNAESVR